MKKLGLTILSTILTKTVNELKKVNNEINDFNLNKNL